MNKKSKKAYEKAMDYYEKGKINKALEVCELELAQNLRNSNILNFKGLLLYQRGELNEAITVWKFNKDINNDIVAQNYINNAMADKERLELYKEGEHALKQLKIDRALELFKRCSESDFNSIKVNTGIGLCYQKKGDFFKAKEYVDKALNLDKSAVTANILKKELEESIKYYNPQKSSEKIFRFVASLMIVIVLSFAGYSIVMKRNILMSQDKVHQNENDESEIKENIESKPEVIQKDIKNEPDTINNFNKEKVETLINNKDYDGIYDAIKDVKEESIGSDNREAYKQAIDLIKSDGVSKFYEYGLWYFNQGNYSDAKDQLDKAYKYCEGNNLKEHIIFYRASTTLKQSDNKAAIQQYEEYYNQYSDGSYIQEVLYELALLNNPENKDKSKYYANTLAEKYPNSLYVNDKIINIINN